MLRGRFGRALAIFAVSFVCLWLAAVATGFAGLHFALLLAGCGAAADSVMVYRRSGKSASQMEHPGWSVAVTIAAGAALLVAALIFREIVQRLLSSS